MKNKQYLLLAGCLLAFLLGCSACTSTFYKLNTNPDATTHVKSSMLATGVIKDMVTKIWELNLWHEGSKVPNGYQGIVDVLDQVDADVVFLCEIRDFNGKKFMPRVVEDLKKRGKLYYGETLGMVVGVMSKIKPDSLTRCCIVPGDETRAMLKAVITIEGAAGFFLFLSFGLLALRMLYAPRIQRKYLDEDRAPRYRRTRSIGRQPVGFPG